MSYMINKDGKKEYYQVNYVQKFYEEIFYGLLEEAYDNSLISHNENFIDYVKSRRDISSFYVMTLSIIADSIEDVYYDITDVYYSNKIKYAMGTDLDDIGDIIGCPRPQATRAGVELTFKLANPFDFVIPFPKNIIVSNSKGISYYTVESYNIPIGETEFKVYALAIDVGSKYRVEKNTLTIMDDEVVCKGTTIGVSVNNEKSSSGGRNTFTDEEYRELLLNWIKIQIKGSREAYMEYFSNMDGLDSYKLIPNWNGITGTVKIVLDPGIPQQLQNVYDDLNGRVSQFSEDIYLFSPDYVPIDIYAVCDVDIDVINPYSGTEKDSIKSRIEQAIRDYIDGDLYALNRKEQIGLELGEDFIPYKLGVYISQKVPELKNIGFKYPLNPVKITDEQMCQSNKITVEMNKVANYDEIDLDYDNKADFIGLDLNDDEIYDIITTYGLK